MNKFYIAILFFLVVIKHFAKSLKSFFKNLENRKYFFKNILFISIVLLTLVLVIDKSNAKYGNKTAIAKA